MKASLHLLFPPFASCVSQSAGRSQWVSLEPLAQKAPVKGDAQKE